MQSLGKDGLEWGRQQCSTARMGGPVLYPAGTGFTLNSSAAFAPLYLPRSEAKGPSRVACLLSLAKSEFRVNTAVGGFGRAAGGGGSDYLYHQLQVVAHQHLPRGRWHPFL